MCGIAGVISSVDNPTIPKELWMARRGPDGSGFWTSNDGRVALSHVRLSVIDITNAGHQPMMTHDNKIVMVFNGEIYNYKQLKVDLINQGYHFKSQSDSEVLLYLFARYGVSCFSKLNGIFSAAFWEVDAKILTLVRDPMGVKPLYFSETPNGFCFASEIKGVASL